MKEIEQAHQIVEYRNSIPLGPPKNRLLRRYWVFSGKWNGPLVMYYTLNGVHSKESYKLNYSDGSYRIAIEGAHETEELLIRYIMRAI